MTRSEAWTVSWLCIVAAGIGSADGRVLDVPGDYPSIRAAVDAARPGDTVLLAPGTYAGPDNADITVAIEGLRVSGAAGPEQTVVDAEGRSRIFRVTQWVDDIVLDGMTLRNGSTGGNGAAIFADVFTGVLVNDCAFENNVASGSGGAMYAYAAEIDVVGSTFAGNSSGAAGGAVAGFESSVEARHCVFFGNSAAMRGGVYEGNDYAIATFTNCLMVGNDAPAGGALAPGFAGFLTIDQCTLADHRSSAGAVVDMQDGWECRIRNSILWNPDSPVEIRDDGGWEEADVQFSDVRGRWPGTGNLDADPAFGAFRDFRYILAPGSPCIDAGDPEVADGVSDSHPRWPANYPNGTRSDMGAYGGRANSDWLR